MSLPIDVSFDPNTQFSSKELAIVVRASQDLQNKTLSSAKLGEVTDALHRSTLDIDAQIARMGEVTSDDTYGRAGALLKAIKNLLQLAEVERKTITKPILDLKESVDAVFKVSATNNLAAAGKLVEARMLAYFRAKKEREEAVAAAERARIEGEARRQADLAVAMGDQETAQVITAAAAELVKDTAPQKAVVESHGVKTQIRTYKRVVVEDLRAALAYITRYATPAELEGIVSLNSRALSSFVARTEHGELKPGKIGLEGTVPTGLTVTETDGISNF